MIIQADAIRLPFADKSVDLVMGSPPYCDARTYGIGAQRDCMEWVEWMLVVTTEAQRVSRGPVIWVAAGVTRDRNYWPACEGLMWEWWKRGGECQLYRPVYWHRVGIPGSGGKDWFRADVEYCMCFKRPGELPWSDNTAHGRPPVFGPGGDFSNRRDNGDRVRKRVNRVQRNGDGERSIRGDEVQHYRPPEIANPGNMLRTKNGGGAMGHHLSHQSEAPYPERVPEFFILSLCKPGGTVLDPFSGSGTTKAVAERFGRIGIGCDIRMNQCELTRRRCAEVQTEMFVA